MTTVGRVRAGWNFADVWESLAHRFPDSPAQETESVVYSWSDFNRRADAVASALLDAGLSRQSKVAQYLYNGPEYLESMFASFKASLVPVNTNYRYVEDELAYLWDNADVEAVIFHGDLDERCDILRSRLPRIRTWICVDAGKGCPDWAIPYEGLATSGVRPTPRWSRSGEDLYLLYTGGTTGAPKGVMWEQDSLLSMLDAPASRRVTDSDDADIHAAALPGPGPKVFPVAPLMHGTAAWFAMSALMIAGSVVTIPSRRFDVEQVLDTVVQLGVKGLCIVGDAFARPIVDAVVTYPGRWDLSGIRVVLSSGTMFTPEIKSSLLQCAPRAVVLDTFGTSESGTIGRSTSTSEGVPPLGSFVVGEKVRVIDEDGVDVVPGSAVPGRLAVGGHIPLGYYKDPAKTSTTFLQLGDRRYVVAGDWATVEADGSVRLLGRGSNCINTGGEKVFPEEVEEALKLHPSIRDAAVIGLPDERLGQKVVAVVETKSSAHFDPDEVIRDCKRRLAAYKAPKLLVEVVNLQRSPSGKLDYALITEVAKGALP